MESLRNDSENLVQQDPRNAPSYQIYVQLPKILHYLMKRVGLYYFEYFMLGYLLGRSQNPNKIKILVQILQNLREAQTQNFLNEKEKLILLSILSKKLNDDKTLEIYQNQIDQLINSKSKLQPNQVQEYFKQILKQIKLASKQTIPPTYEQLFMVGHILGKKTHDNFMQLVSELNLLRGVQPDQEYQIFSLYDFYPGSKLSDQISTYHMHLYKVNSILTEAQNTFTNQEDLATVSLSLRAKQNSIQLSINEEEKVEEQKIKVVQCPGCFENIEEESENENSLVVKVEGCGHIYHKECLGGWVKSQMEERKFPVSCFEQDCKQIISEITLQYIFDQIQINKFNIFCIEAVQMQFSDVVACKSPNCNYTTLVLPTDTDFVCIQCQKICCSKCCEDMHYGETCEEFKNKTLTENQKQFEELMQTQNTAKCPKCGVWIELLHGCFHMTCPCKNQFCYVCKTNYEYDPNDTTDESKKKKKAQCDCPLFDEKFLLYS